MKSLAVKLYRQALRTKAGLLRFAYRTFVQKGGEAVHFRFRGFEIHQHGTDPYWVAKHSGGLDDFAHYAEAVRRFCGESPVIIDVGANIGLASLAFGKVTGARVEAFEPVKRTFGFLEKNIGANGLANVRAHNFGLSDAMGELLIGAPSADADSGSFSVIETDAASGAQYVETARFETLDATAEALGLERIDYLKIDAEGHDAQVLKGGRLSVERFSPVIQIEISTLALSDRSELDFFRSFIDVGNYTVFQVYKGLHRVDDLDAFFGQAVIQKDLILVPPQRT